jgi:hypothetical protein
VTKMVASVRNKGKIISQFTLRVFVLRDDFSKRINRVIRGFAVSQAGPEIPSQRRKCKSQSKVYDQSQ